MSSNSVLVLGAGNIGLAVTKLLWKLPDISITVACELHEYDEVRKKLPVEILVINFQSWKAALPNHNILINALPHFLNAAVVDHIYKNPVHYFDFSEDVFYTQNHDWTQYPKAFVPHCGLAPGLINIVGGDMIKNCPNAQDLEMFVGALPQVTPNNPLKYSVTWSIDGLINEYLNPCKVLIDGKVVERPGLEDRVGVLFYIDEYEEEYVAFNTSGGIGTMIDTYKDRMKNMSYKTIRPITHADTMLLLLDGLKLRNRTDLLKKVLQGCLPITTEDMVLIQANVYDDSGNGSLYERKIFGKDGLTAIQLTTASGMVGVIELMIKDGFPSGYIKQENIDFDKFIETNAGAIYK